MKNQKRGVVFVGRCVFWAVLLGGGLFSAKAVTIISEPILARATQAPLAGTLLLTTDVPTRVSVTVNDGIDTWKRNFFTYSTSHALPMYGFKFDRVNKMTVTVYDKALNAATYPTQTTFVTGSPPDGFPVINVLKSRPDLMEPGYTLTRVVNLNQQRGYVLIFDNSGRVVWYGTMQAGSEISQLPNGNLFTPLNTSFQEINLLGNLVQGWPVPSNLRIDTHDVVKTDRNTFLYITTEARTLTNFPSSSTNPNAPKQTNTVQANRMIELTTTNSVVNNWDLLTMLEPLRITDLTFIGRTSQGWDHHHGNAIIEDPRDGSIIYSLRNQNAVVKFSRATGKVKWILSPHEGWGPELQPYLLTPVGAPFRWSYGQHAPRITPQGTLLLYDNGNFRAMPFDPGTPDSENFSRAVEYEINEETMEIRQVWEFGENVAAQEYTPAVGNVEILPKTGHLLVNFGFVTYVNHEHTSPVATGACMAHVREMTREATPQIVFDLTMFDYNKAFSDSTYAGNYAYRTYRIPDLYGHEPMPVQDLSVKIQDGLARLQFSADPVRSYRIQASTDLANWDDIGGAEFDADGICRVSDLESDTGDPRFYRILTQ
jgi:arylsulfate sulfotransferase